MAKGRGPEQPAYINVTVKNTSLLSPPQVGMTRSRDVGVHRVTIIFEPSVSKTLDLRLPDSPAKRKFDKQTAVEKAKQKLEEKAAEERVEQKKRDAEQSERFENRARRGGTPFPRKFSSNIDGEEYPPRKNLKKDPLPERSRKDRGQFSVPADDINSRYLNRERAEKLERDHKEREDRERRKREKKEEQERRDEQDRREREDLERRKSEKEKRRETWNEHERIGREEEDKIYKQKRDKQGREGGKEEDPLERAWNDKLRKEREKVAEQIAIEESARKFKPRTATRETIGRDEGGRTKQRASDTRTKGKRDRKPRDRSRSRDRYDRGHARVRPAHPETNTGGGARHKDYGSYTYSPLYIRKPVPKPEMDGRGDEKMYRDKKDRDQTRDPELIARPRRRDEADQYGQYVPTRDPLSSSHESRHAPPLSRSAPRKTAHNDSGYEYNDERPGKYRY
ncbi:hypothetical protein BELL_0293g00060 [Botrytis elliptica]|uniref:Uncharacterized protein n=1 Tax=Botrytis elliptica TaxID=278938 RepID=A0A4Z1JLE0_9HELO|nr:hypothetical protein BELL_0293g00060 [Botrytis elliptica]